ncbi:M13 family metallopeptidase [Paucibacter soli]|uniref:M13 family metallopeptidase n=1 Tax=Paucibacter soli TaxID=3133433 RepID=UPI003095484F
MLRPTPLAAALLLAISTLGAQALDLKGLSSEVPACSDFYGHVNGLWESRTELPANRTRVGSFEDLRRANDALLEKALAELVQDRAAQDTPGLALLAQYYASGMDLAAIEARGLAPLQPLLQRIAGLQRAEELPAKLPVLLAELARLQIAAPMGVFVRSDVKDPTRHALMLGAGGLGLPDRDDYFASDATSARIKAAYRRYAQTLMAAAGTPLDEPALDAVLAMETALAEATKTRAQQRDPRASYNPMSPAELAAAAPGFDWQAYLGALSTTPTRKGGVERVIVTQPEFAKRLAQLAGSTGIATWRHYLQLRLLDASADRLPKAFAQAHYDYYGATILGQQAPTPRNEEVIQAIGGRYGNAPLSQALGELYVRRAFSAEAQQRSLALVADIKSAMQRRISELSWMSAPTKQRALEKLAAMVPKIGAPEKWPDYQDLALSRDDYAGNMLRVNAWATQRQINDLDRPVDRKRWNTSPHIVNAFAGGLNEITFPAGILQPPFFDAKADDAVNYGGIGMVIGHEITHHFDDRGRQYDALGRLNDWWTAEDAAGYKARAERVVALYGGYKPLPDHSINGQLTLGENISDMSGLPIAFEGLQLALKRTGKTEKVDGYTPEQRFFLSNAIVWRGKTRTEFLINQLRTDGHSPGKFRVLGPMSNSPAFAKAFDCKAGDGMVSTDPITVW